MKSYIEMIESAARLRNDALYRTQVIKLNGYMAAIADMYENNILDVYEQIIEMSEMMEKENTCQMETSCEG